MSYPRVTEILQKYFDAAGIPEGTLAAAQERGTVVHAAVAAYALGLWASVPEDLQGFFDSFKRWFDVYVQEVISVEMELVNGVWQYQGHADLIAKVIGYVTATPVIAVIDYKTPVAAKNSWRMQCAAYVEASRKDYGVEIGGALQLRKDGGIPKMIWVDDQNTAFAAFTGTLSGWHYNERRK
jgi:hypothetical protein